MRPLSPRERRLVALGVLVGLVGIVWLAIIGPLVGGFASRAAEREELRATYQRNTRMMAALPVWRAVAETQRRSAPRFAMSAPSESLAGEALKERLRKLSTDEGFAITGVQDLQADAPRGRVRLRADIALNLTQLCEMLRRLETEGPYVVVDYLSISADRAFASGHSAPMDVRLELSAAWRPDAGRAS